MTPAALSSAAVRTLSPAVPPLRRITADEFERMPDTAGWELVDGRIQEKIVGAKSSRYGFRLGAVLEHHCASQPIGHVFGADMGYRCFGPKSDLVRKPDVSLIRLGRLPNESLPEGDCTLAPDLAVESVSPNDTYCDLDRKISEYFDAGVRRVWVINPELRTVRAFWPDGSSRLYRFGDTLSDEEVVPGFVCPIREIFRPPAGVPAEPVAEPPAAPVVSPAPPTPSATPTPTAPSAH